MRTSKPARSKPIDLLAKLLICVLIVGQAAQPAFAAVTLLADVPIAAKVTAKPNIVYTVDDSGSMLYSYLPDFVVKNFCRSGNNVAACSEIRFFNSSFYWPPVLNADFNHLAYNPNVNYTPPLTYDGTPMTYPLVTDAGGNQTNFARVQRDPYLAKPTQDALTNKVNVLLYCNTDWPLNTTFGDANGEYLPGSGDWCRINGTKYDASMSSGAPAVIDDYNYPYQKSSGADNTKYFYRTPTSKTIWCDTSSPNWPRATSGGTCSSSCTAGSITTTPQTCNAGGALTTCCTGIGSPAGCTTVSTYTIPGCKGNALYCGPYGTGSAPECLGGCGCNAQPYGRAGACSSTAAPCNCTGNGCTPTLNGNPACPDQPTGCTGGGTLVTTCTGPALNAACSTMRTDNNMTLLADANGPGTVCRHNNTSYSDGTTAGPFKYPGNYPGEGLGSGNFNKAATSGGCPAITNPVQIPRHYYTVDSVQFCSATNNTANDPWQGFGAAPCQSKNDFATYKNVQYGQFHRIDLVAGRTYNYVDQVSGAASTRTYAEEIVNYANWYAYYRTRILATKTTSALAFSYLDDTYRVGFHNLGEELPPNGSGTPVTWVNVNDWKLGVGNQRDQWYAALFAIAPTNFKTPSIDALLRIGNLFQTGGASGLPAVVNPLPAGTTDPITLSCQNNYHILFTDGFTNQLGKPAVVGNQDKNVPAWGATIIDNPPNNVMPNLRALSGSAWPKPFAESGAPSVSDSLADVSTYYWVTDLRPALKNDVPAWSGKDPNDKDPSKDIAWWQHVNFNAISFGSEGQLNASDQTTTLASIVGGSAVWTPTLVLPATPQPYSPNNPAGNPGASAVDDLWHATVNSRGKFVYAKSPLEVSYGLASILAGIQNQEKSRVGAAFSGQVLDSSNNIVYESKIEPGWAGDLLKVQIDPTTGAEVSTLWQVSTQLAAQIKPASPGDEPWFTNRRIVTINSGSGLAVPFLYANLSAAQLASLSPDATKQQHMIAYLRGGSTFGPGPTPTIIEGTGIGQFRQRFGPIGDISNAQPVIVGPPTFPYVDATDPKYGAYKTAQTSRSTRIVAAANDGMAHVIDADTGDEVFAFIPKALFRGVAGNVATEDTTALQALTYQDGGVPIFHHHMYVDSSPRRADVDFGNGTGDWHTIVVGGLGKGGNSYYALDLTDPSATDESAAAGKVLWEWSDPDVKYTYGRPVIVKVRDSGYPTGRWVVLVTASYNNVSGLGKIFVLDARTGTTLNTFSTGVGTGVDPSGLAQIHAFVKDEANQIAEQIYGGDLMGNVWRVDVSGVDQYKTATPVLFAQLTDPGGNPQPVTTAPQIEIDLNNGIDRYVFVGTGRLLDTSDLTTPSPPQAQTMYAIRDGSLSAVQTTGLPIQPRTTLSPINTDGVSAIVGGAPNGWYHDLPATPPTAERIVVDPQSDVNIATYVGTQVQTDPCLIALPANLYARDYTSASSLLLAGGVVVPAAYFASGTVGVQNVGRVQTDGSQSLGGIVSYEDPKKGGIGPVDFVNPLSGPASRLSWRLLTGQQ